MEVFTHGLTVSPRSTAFFASSAAPSITEGLDVLVHEVIEAITTAPWSSTKSPRDSERTGVGLDGRPSPPLAAECAAEGATGTAASSSAKDSAGASLAGKDSQEASSTWLSGASASSV